MTDVIVPAIVFDEYIRAAEARRLAYDVFYSAPKPVQEAISRYGQFIDHEIAPLPVAMKEFFHATGKLPTYQEAIEPLRPYEERLSEFEDLFAADVYRLVNGMEV